jgi:GlpG protein
LRQIGTLPQTADPRVFTDYLLSIGVTTRVVEASGGWDVWVHNEDLVPKAREEFAAYEKSPDDPRYRSAARAAEEVRRENQRLDRQYQKNARDVRSSWTGLQARRRPLTLLVIGACVAIYLVGEASPRYKLWLFDRLAFFSIDTLRRHQDDLTHGLDDVLRGEVWRLLTPALLHGSVAHIVFNMWATIVEGTIIESRRGTRTLAALMLFSAVVSNLGQYVYVQVFYPVLVPWVGFSGVGYAMFGYLWMKGLYEPEQGMVLHPSTVRIMLFWLLLGFAGFMNMANGAHLAGLIAGVVFGLARL